MNVALAGVGTAAQAIIQTANDPSVLAACPWLAPLGVVVGAVAGHEINRLAARVDRIQLQNAASDALLTNEHLSRVQSAAIKARLRRVAERRRDAGDLVTIADRSNEWWPRVVEAGVDEAKSVDDEVFAQRIAEYLAARSAAAPGKDEWRAVIDVAASFVALPNGLAPDMADEASEALAAHFMADAIEALKLDFAQGGEAFARVELTFFSQIHFGVQDVIGRLAAQGDVARNTLDAASAALEEIQKLARMLGSASLEPKS